MSAGTASDHRYVGRFAPSPTGALHFGSLMTALGSYIRARHAGGEWLIRIEDLDPPREKSGAAEDQLATLANFGLVSDQPVERQSAYRARHELALKDLRDRGLAFLCNCSRRKLPADGIYPGNCRNGPGPGRRARALRFRVDDDAVIEFEDALQGPQSQCPARQCGDFIIHRSDGLIAYQLAVVVDDAAAGITEVVRGEDLLHSTGRQIMLQRALGLPQPDYLHLPLIVGSDGHKLSKSRGDDPIRRYPPAMAMRQALRALGHEPPPLCKTMPSQLDWAIEHWCLERIPKGPIAIDVQNEGPGDYTPTIERSTDP